MEKTIVLASGGLDSSLVMARLLEASHIVVPFFTDYGQYSVEGERRAVRNVVTWLRDQPNSFNLKDVVEAKVDIGRRVAASPGRVLAFCGAAAVWAYTENWDGGTIAIGIHKGDKDQDSCRVGYEGDLDNTLKSLTQGCMRIITPLMGMSRRDMALEIKRYGIPWELMYNCYWYPPCGWQSTSAEYRCPGCRRKAESMAYAGVQRHVQTGEGGAFDPVERPNTGVMDSFVARRDWTKWT